MYEDCFHLGVKALICDKNGMILLLKKLHSSKKLYQDLPGGRVHKNESEMDALYRELQEEIGFQDIGDPRLFMTFRTNLRIPVSQGDVGLILSIYHCESKVHFVPQLSNEHCGFGWYTPFEASQLLSSVYPKDFVESLSKLSLES